MEGVSNRKGSKRSFQAVSQMKKTKELSREHGTGRRGFTPMQPGTYKVSIEELKKRTRCGVCKQVGHWHKDKECPGMPPTAGKEIQFLQSESEEAMFIHSHVSQLQNLNRKNIRCEKKEDG